MLTRLSRPRTLTLCALPVLALFGVAAFAPLPFTLAQPGITANVLGDDHGTPVISIKGTPTRPTKGQLRMTTIVATGPTADVGIGDVIDGWFRTDRAVLPRDSVYPTGGSEKEIEQHNLDDMVKSQDSAVDAALNYLGKKPGSVDVTLHLADVGGPSAGLFFALGIVDKLDGDGSGAISPAAAPSPAPAPSRRTARSARSAVSRSRRRRPTGTGRPSSSYRRPSARRRTPSFPTGSG